MTPAERIADYDARIAAAEADLAKLEGAPWLERRSLVSRIRALKAHQWRVRTAPA
jgi:hypothetical protein